MFFHCCNLGRVLGVYPGWCVILTVVWFLYFIAALLWIMLHSTEWQGSMRKTEMWGRQRAECLKPPHLVTVFSCHHCTETPGGLCEALLVCVCKWKMSSKFGEKGSRISGRKNETTVPHLSENIWKCDISATAQHILLLDTMECGYFNNIKLFHHVLFKANDRQQWNPHQSK